MQSDVSRTILFGLVQGPSPVGLCRARFPFDSCVAAPRVARRAKRGGARRDRTDDLMLAKHALSQLSYGPVPEDECCTLEARLRPRGLRRARFAFVQRGCATRSRRRSVVGL